MTGSIRKQLIIWLLSMLVIISVGRIWYGYYQAIDISNGDYDEQLLNSADSVAARLQLDNGMLTVNLPPDTLSILNHNQADTFYYEMFTSSGKRIAGNTKLLASMIDLNSLDKPYFKTITLNHESCRFIQARLPVPEAGLQSVIAICAETEHTRTNLTNRIVTSIALAQLIVIVASFIAVFIAINSVFVPLSLLRQLILKRSVNDLTTIDNKLAPTEVQPLIDAINDLLARSREEVESRNRFVANAAHQLRTPIAGLKTYTSMSDGLTTLNDFRLVMNKLDTGLDRLIHLVNQLLALARVENATLIPRDLKVIVSEAIAELLDLALEKEIEVKLIAPEEAAMINGDTTGLTQLTSNLLENAIRYCPPKSQIGVRIFSTNNCIALAVEDNGPGIPVEERERVFERFYRLADNDGIGCGLGLSIVQEVVLVHRATVTIGTPSARQGTIVTVVFPQL